MACHCVMCEGHGPLLCYTHSRDDLDPPACQVILQAYLESLEEQPYSIDEDIEEDTWQGADDADEGVDEQIVLKSGRKRQHMGVKKSVF